MVKKSKGRQRIEMVRMENESNLQVTFSKRRAGLFKKASELCTLCAAEVAIIVFSPGRKVFSFGHPNVEAVIDKFMGNNPPPHNQNNMQLSDVRNTVIQQLNNHLTEVLNQLEVEKKKNEDLRKIREETKKQGNWMEDAIEGFDLGQVNEFKGHLDNLKKRVALEASKIFEAHIPQQNFYVESSSNINSGMDMFGPRRIMDNMNPFNYNHNNEFNLQALLAGLPNLPLPTNLPNQLSSGLPDLPNQLTMGPFGNNDYGNTADQGYNTNYMPEYQQYHNAHPSFKTEDSSEYERYKGYHLHSRLGPLGHGHFGPGPSGAEPSGAEPSGVELSGAGPSGAGSSGAGTEPGQSGY